MITYPLGFVAPPATAPAHDYTAFYLFDEGSGTTLGDQTGNHPGTISNCTWSTVDKPTGAAGSLAFVSSSTSKVLISPMLPDTSDFAFSMWIKLASTGTAECIMSWGSTAVTYAVRMLRYGSGGFMGVGHWDGGWTGWLAGAISAGGWHHFVVNWAVGTNNLDVYLDGAFSLQTTIDPALSNLDVFTMGGKQQVGYIPEFNGSLSCLSFYERALTAPEIALMYADPTYAP